jgi:hypothetical protein
MRFVRSNPDSCVRLEPCVNIHIADSIADHFGMKSHPMRALEGTRGQASPNAKWSVLHARLTNDDMTTILHG